MKSLLTDALACHRLARLVTEDVLTAPLRDRLIEKAYARAGRAQEEAARQPDRTWTERVGYDDNPPKLAFLATCPWCSGFYLAVGVVVTRAVAPRAWEPVARALALSSAAGLLAAHEG